ncbi:C40 family peptidase [Ectobacillus panaciterrae]|uniref:C40 family peptidase n=1 Tax=Ectobacillus panaciterrae TaxID=363872 RepID=UPI00041D3F80|nr:C40 family peptidase [Ectobacillus panaciterrae]
MKNLKMVTCVLATGLMMFSAVAPSVHAERDAELQSTLHTQEQQRNDLQKQMDELKKTVQDVQTSIQENEKKLTETKDNITETQRLIQEKTAAINELQKKIEQREVVIKKRLVSLQSQPTTNIVTEVVVNAQSFADLLDRISSVNMVFQSDKSILETQERDKDQVKKDREIIVQKEQELRAFLAELEKTNKTLAEERQQKQAAWDEMNDKFQKLVNDIANTQSALTEAQKQKQEKEMEKQSLFLQNTSDGETVAPAPAPAQAPSNKPAKQQPPAGAANGGVVGKALQYLGVPYVWGGASPSGFDCSGFISYIYGVGRQDVSGYWNSVSRIDNPQPGDLVFFQGTYKAGPSHIGIYIGDGKMVHAGDSGIAVSSLSSSYNRSHFLGYGRF